MWLGANRDVKQLEAQIERLKAERDQYNGWTQEIKLVLKNLQDFIEREGLWEKYANEQSEALKDQEQSNVS